MMNDGIRRLGAALLALACASGAQAARCNSDSLGGAGFESLRGLRIAGLTLPLQAATVELRHGDTVLASVQTINDNFDLALPPIAPEAVLELRARGIAARGEEFIELASYVGSAEQIAAAALTSGTTATGALPTLAVTPESTARYALLRAAAPAGKPAQECDLATRTAALDATALRERTAVIKLMIENQGTAAGRAKGVAPAPTTLETVSDPILLQTEIAAIEADRPGALAATVALLSEDFCAHFAGEALFIPARASERLNIVGGTIYDGIDATRGLYSSRFGSDGYDFTCSGGSYSATFDGDLVTTDFPIRVVAGVAQQVESRVSTEAIRLTRIDVSGTIVAVAIESTARRTFPFEPSLPDEFFRSAGRLDLVRGRQAAPFDPVELPGREVVLGTRLELSNGGQRDLEYERLAFAAAGAGTAIDAGGSFSWTVDAGGELRLQFSNRVARVIPLRDEPGATAVLVVLDRDNGSRAVNLGWLVRRDPAAAWEPADGMPAQYVQNAARVYTDTLAGSFRFDFLGDRQAPTFTTSVSGETPGAVLYWSRPDASTVVLRQCQGRDGGGVLVQKAIIDRAPVAGECTDRYRERRWTLLRRTPQPGGDYLWVIEDNRDWFGTDPTVTGIDQPPSTFYRGQFYQRRPLPAAR
jgi:hypothetical protein